MSTKPEEMILCKWLTETGSKVASKRLAKEKKGTYPETGTPADIYTWWMQYKEGKQKKKIAVSIMAFHYTTVVKHLDQFRNEALQLENKTKSLEEEVNFLKRELLRKEAENKQLFRQMSEMSSEASKLQSKTDSQENKIILLFEKVHKQEGENALLLYQMSEMSNEALQLKSKTQSQKKQITLLKQKVQKQEAENTQLLDQMSEMSIAVLQLKSKTDSQEKQITLLKQTVQEQKTEKEELKHEIVKYKANLDDSKSLIKCPLVVTSSSQRTLLSLLAELPDLEYDNSNYEFWAKIKSWLLKGEVAPRCVFKLVQKKCPLKAWQIIAEKFVNKALEETDFSNHVETGRQVEKLWKCVSEALGPGTKLFDKYYYRKQEAGETFETYIQEKFKLYCSFGVENTEPDRNDRHFLYNVIEKAARSYQTLQTLQLLGGPTSYTDLVARSMLVDRMLMGAEWNNKCLNCCRQGHTIAYCRRPGGEAEVGPNECYTCGKHGHWARDCWSY